jgi:hypothetical protein
MCALAWMRRPKSARRFDARLAAVGLRFAGPSGLEESKLAILGALPGHRLIEPLGDLRAEVGQEDRRGTAMT